MPSERLLKKFKSHTIDSSKALCTLRNKLLIGNDVVIQLDEMYLQTQVQFDGKSVIGCDGDLNIFKSILCFMVVSLKKTIPYVMIAIPIVRLTFLDVYNGILNCISILNEGKFHFRGVIADNHSTNVKAYNVLVKNFPLDDRKYCINNPSNSAQHIFLTFDTVHLVKNIRNNLISSRFFQVPQFLFNLQDTVFNIPPGFVIWSHLHQVHTHDLTLNAHLKKTPKLSYYLLHPGNNKQSVPLALAVFEPTTTSAIRSYFPEEYTTIAFLELIHAWWLVVNAKERFHPTRIGNALVANDKIDFLRAISDWLETWNSSQFIGLTKLLSKLLHSLIVPLLT